MNLRRIALAAVLIAAVSCQQTSQTNDPVLTRDGIEVSRSYGGIHNPYPTVVPDAPAAPKGYEVCYISHYGRHGSRFIHLESQYSSIYNTLKDAHDEGLLSEEGEGVYERFMQVYPDLKGRSGELTPLGQVQHRQIAHRMVKNYPSLFGKSRKIQVRTTNLERTMLSMNAFLNEVKVMKPATEMEIDGSRTEMNYLNAHSWDNPYMNNEDMTWRSRDGEWSAPFTEFVKSRIDIRGFASRVFNDVDKADAQFDLYEFERQMFFFSLHLPGCPVPQVGFFDLFNEAELIELGKIEPAEFYYMKGLYPSPKARAAILSESLLHDFLDKTEQDLADGVSVRLRFGHDGCMVALFALMECPGWDQVENDIEKIWGLWNTEEIPMGANIQMVFYRPKAAKDNDGLIFTYLLNEKPMALPLDEVTTGFYSWNDFQAKYRPMADEAKKVLDEAI